MTRAKKIALGLLAGIVVIPCCWFAADWAWYTWSARDYGYELAGIKPVSGARLLLHRYEPSDGFLPDGETSWVYQMPKGYLDDLYKDCSKHMYKQGVLVDKVYVEADRYIDRNGPGCYLHKEDQHNNVTIQFSDDKLIVEDIYY